MPVSPGLDVNVGGRFGCGTAIEKLCVALPPRPSLTVTTTGNVPATVGVHAMRPVPATIVIPPGDDVSA